MFNLPEGRGIYQELLFKIWKQIEVYGRIILSPFRPRRGIVVIKMPFGAFFLFLTVVGIIIVWKLIWIQDTGNMGLAQNMTAAKTVVNVG